MSWCYDFVCAFWWVFCSTGIKVPKSISEHRLLWFDMMWNNFFLFSRNIFRDFSGNFLKNIVENIQCCCSSIFSRGFPSSRDDYSGVLAWLQVYSFFETTRGLLENFILYRYYPINFWIETVKTSLSFSSRNVTFLWMVFQFWDTSWIIFTNFSMVDFSGFYSRFHTKAFQRMQSFISFFFTWH